MPTNWVSAADHHASRARALADKAVDRCEENAVEAVEIASLATAHALAAIATVLASGSIDINGDVNTRRG